MRTDRRLRNQTTSVRGVSRFLLWQLLRACIGFLFFWIGFAEGVISEARKIMRTNR